MRPGWNPVRRNRKIGTAAQGHGADNRMEIPENRYKAHHVPFYQNLGQYHTIEYRLGSRILPLIIQPPQAGWFYPCTPEDIITLLARCPPADLGCLDFLILRQPTHKQHILSTVWGRTIFNLEHPKYKGTAIILEAQNLEPLKWPFSLGTYDQQERERLLKEGHREHRTRKHIEFHTTPASLRHTQLYRTLLHELGHLVDYCSKGHDQYWSRPEREREEYAERYAGQMITRFQQAGHIPFNPLFDPEQLKRDGLQPGWFFAAPESAHTPDHPDELCPGERVETPAFPHENQ
ncbi:MAG: hypothetical protein ACRDD3_13890 [Azovibrio sp.]